MRLDELYRQVKEAVAGVDLRQIWPGFEALRFALYDDEACCFDGRYIEKTDAFCANTSIVYEGEQIAIWGLREELDIPVLASKIVHEMFHGYQQLQGWDCWPQELEALFRYEYQAENLSLKLRENALLSALQDRFDPAAYRELLSHRRRRMALYPYAFSYESKVEEIEGTANYVEWQVLKQLDEKKAAALAANMCAAVTDPEALFPIRRSCYFTGTLLIDALRRAGDYSFTPSRRPAILSVLEAVAPSDGCFPGKDACDRAASAAVEGFRAESAFIVRRALEKNEVVLTGPLALVSVNVYDARRFADCITSRYFLICRDEGGRTDAVRRLRDPDARRKNG